MGLQNKAFKNCTKINDNIQGKLKKELIWINAYPSSIYKKRSKYKNAKGYDVLTESTKFHGKYVNLLL